MLESVSNYLGNVGIGISCYWNRDRIQGFGKTLESESLSALPELESKSRVPELLTTLVWVRLIYEIDEFFCNSNIDLLSSRLCQKSGSSAN